MATRSSINTMASRATSDAQTATPPAANSSGIHKEKIPHDVERRSRAGRKLAAATPNGGRAAPLAVKRSVVGTVLGWAVAILAIAAIGWAWDARLEGHLTPASGVGYWLGITGSLMMLSLLLYPLRKTSKKLSNLPSVPAFYLSHVLLGVAGPTLVIVHSNFQLSSTNGTVAMLVTLAVVASGLFGRFVYFRLLKRLAFQQLLLSDLLAESDTMLDAFGVEADRAPDLVAELRILNSDLNGTELETDVRPGLRALLSKPFNRRGGVVRRNRLKADATSRMAAQALRERWNPQALSDRTTMAHDYIDDYFLALGQAKKYYQLNKLVRSWHVFHMPMFFLLVVVVIGHVIAVHLY
jgi:hypothetical protein